MNRPAVLREVTDRIIGRSRESRAAYLDLMRSMRSEGPRRLSLSCGNIAHGYAACPASDKEEMRGERAANIGIVTAYNDMLSAHQPFQTYPDIIKAALREVRATGQVAGGVPAMCDGVTQGQDGMELSLFSRDVIAMSTAIALSHDMFDGVLALGVCDKIVPGLLMGALRFGHLPAIFVPAGPMRSGLPNPEKARIRQLYAEGKVGREKLLAAESASYHSPGTCTFYGTANSNQMLMEIMGLHLPGAAFINPDDPLRPRLTEAAARRIVDLTASGSSPTPLCEVVDERAIVNAIVGLHATGGSTNHTLHLVAIARAAGIIIDWDDFDDLAGVTPLLCRIYPNGPADVNHFHAAGGLALVIRELLDAGLLHEDVQTVAGRGLAAYAEEPVEAGDGVRWQAGTPVSADTDIVRGVAEPFSADGGLKVLDGPLGRAVIKVSAVKPEHRIVTAPAIVFDDQDSFLERFRAGELDRDFIAVIRFQGPRANGMPELHKLSPSLGVLQDRGFKVALVTDGRMSGASGKVPSAIHVCPEAACGGPLAKVMDGDVITLNGETGELSVDPSVLERTPARFEPVSESGLGRELFAGFRSVASSAETGGISLPGIDQAVQSGETV
ncbi:phosphogluconate dehydratase [Hyphobacterium sp. HN65]|uniref:Phosphogluconate dehydratase n=1 Tax=Hyphobacterium lacteum TaxID=3116575 RepID=A0ABU7LSF3_9PROT|nr:phosphogluconate dehydratase [Hyphobacterium sp. HN65]MEE2526828.1 phosphogluconate dehydratase [Hyphobacterium sp. HN65]